MTDEKMIDDAVTAFTNREVTPPSRDDLRIALDAYAASLTRCGCDECTTARRERTGITDHDRTALARVLHELVYSPGAIYDRAVPGVQEHMLACAEKVAAALPWMVPGPEVTLEVAEVDAILSEHEITEPQGEPPVPEVLGEWFTSSHGVAVAAVAPMTDRGPSVMVDGRVISPNDAAALVEFKTQGEPSDAQVRAAAESLAHSAGYIPEPMVRAALRAAGGVR